MDIRHAYEMLELAPGASSEEISQSYRDLVNVWQPNRFSKIPHLKRKAEKKLRDIEKAYEKLQSTLSNPVLLTSESNAFNSAGGSAFARGVAVEKPRKTSRKLVRTYPLRRFLARIIDYLLFALFLGCLNVYGTLLRLDVPVLLFPIVLLFLWVFVEAAFLSSFGTSPGKWLLVTRIMNRSLERPGYFGALRRSLSVWCNGMGTGIFFIVPVTMAISYQRLKKDGYAPWDREGRFYLIHGTVPAPRFSLAFLCLVGFAVLNAYVIYTQDHSASAPVQEAKRAHEEDDQGKTALFEKSNANREGPVRAMDDYSDAQYRLGKACYELGRYEEAIEALQKVVQIRPGFAEAQYVLGASYAGRNRHAEAKASLLQAIEIKPDYSEAHHILGFVYLNMGDREAAIRQQEILKGLDSGLADELLAFIRIQDRPDSISPVRKP